MNKHLNLKSLALIGGNLLFIVLFFFSAWFWKERQAFDAAHYLLEIVLRKSFFIAHLRPIGVVSQVLPVIGVLLSLPLKWLMILYTKAVDIVNFLKGIGTEKEVLRGSDGRAHV